jgi:hypothetical protein
MARRGRIGAHVTHSRHDSRELAARAREAFLTKLEIEVDPDGVLTPEERRRRAEHARKAHLARASLAAARARNTTTTPKPLTIEREAEHVPA